MFVSKSHWLNLSKSYRTALMGAASVMADQLLRRIDVENPRALKNLISLGAKLKPLPNAVLEELGNASRKVYEEISEKDPTFRQMNESYKKFATDHYLWWRAGDFAVDSLGIRYFARA
jgi:TRAP-type mannitol/chloroaromatic compound transport system substrate-binding protein